MLILTMINMAMVPAICSFLITIIINIIIIISVIINVNIIIIRQNQNIALDLLNQTWTCEVEHFETSVIIASAWQHTSRERKNIYTVNQFINHNIPLWRAMQSKMWFFWKCKNGDNDLSFRRATAAVSCISTWQWGSSLEGGRIKVILTTSQYPCSYRQLRNAVFRPILDFQQRFQNF